MKVCCVKHGVCEAILFKNGFLLCEKCLDEGLVKPELLASLLS